MNLRMFRLGAAALALTAAAPGFAAVCTGVSFGADFAGSYSCNALGTPTGVTGLLGGITFLDSDTLLVGGNANAGNGYIASIDVVRDAANHIIGFSGPSSTFASAPQIDGGLTFGPNGVLFASGFPNNTILQYLPGATTPSKVITLTSDGSLGTLQFVPVGFAGAGQLKVASYSGSQGFYTATLTPDGAGTFDISLTLETNLTGGPEGLVYVDGANAGFGVDSLLVTEYGAGRVGTYTIDANGNPVGPRRDFLTGLSGAEGAVIDPLTGDFLFTTFGSANGLFVIGGFAVPEEPPVPGVPEPASWAMMIAGFGLVGGAMRRRQTVSVTYA